MHYCSKMLAFFGPIIVLMAGEFWAWTSHGWVLWAIPSLCLNPSTRYLVIFFYRNQFFFSWYSNLLYMTGVTMTVKAAVELSPTAVWFWGSITRFASVDRLGGIASWTFMLVWTWGPCDAVFVSWMGGYAGTKSNKVAFLCYEATVPVVFCFRNGWLKLFWLVGRNGDVWCCSRRSWPVTRQLQNPAFFLLHAEVVVITLSVIVLLLQIRNGLFVGQEESSLVKHGIPGERCFHGNSSEDVISFVPLGKENIGRGSISHLSIAVVSLLYFLSWILEAISWHLFRNLKKKILLVYLLSI